MNKIETWLPVFHGFYNTIFEPDESEFLRENECEWDDIVFDNEEYSKDVAESVCETLQTKLKEYVTGIEMQAISSPKFYNFSNDAIHIEITLSKANLKAIRKTIRDNWEKYTEHTLKRYTSRDGFMSFHSNDSDEWSRLTKNFSDFSENTHHLGSVLEFICELEDVTNDTLYAECEVYGETYCTMKEVEQAS